MTYSNIEPKVYQVASWLTEYIPVYLDAATTEMQPWPSDTTFPSILLVPDTAYTPPALRKAAVGTSIPKSGPFPYMLVVLDAIDLEPAAQFTTWITLRLKVIVALQENNDLKLFSAVARYIDALTAAVNKNVTLGGIFDEAILTNIDKNEFQENHVGFITADISAKFEYLCE